MKQMLITILCFMGMIAQSKLSGNVNVDAEYTSFNNSSQIWTNKQFSDSVKENPSIDYEFDKYSTTYLIPGLKQILNLNLFYLSENYRISTYVKLTNSEWITPQELKYIDRLSMIVEIGKTKLVIGDNYLNSNRFFLSQRKIRGFSADVPLYEDGFGQYKLNAFTGISEYEYNIGDKVVGRYNSFYRAKRYQRNLTGADLKATMYDEKINLKMSYLTGKDKVTGEIDSTGARPFNNVVLGADLRVNLYEKQVFLQGHYYKAKNDTITTIGNRTGGEKKSFSYGLGFDNERFAIDGYIYKIDAGYLSLGQPFLINDRRGMLFQGHMDFAEEHNLTMFIDAYNNNLEGIDKKTISSKEVNLKYVYPLTKDLFANVNYLRLSDVSQIEDFDTKNYISRRSNSLDGNIDYVFNGGSFGIISGQNKTNDDSAYGEGVDSLPIGGISSDRSYYGFTGSYGIEDLFSFNASLSINNLQQISIDESTITNFQLNGWYNAIPGFLKITALINVSSSSNNINEFIVNNNKDEFKLTKIRYQLFSAINQFSQNFVEIGSEFVFLANLRTKLTVRYDDKKYNYLDNGSFTSDKLREYTMLLNNPNFFNQKESYSAFFVKVSLGYLL